MIKKILLGCVCVWPKWGAGGGYQNTFVSGWRRGKMRLAIAGGKHFVNF